MPTATLTSKGQTTIPREVREFLKLKSGDKLEFTFNPDEGTVTPKAANIDVLTLKGLLKRKGMKPYNRDERSIALRKRGQKK